MNSDYKMPFYARTAFIFISIFAFVTILRLGEYIIAPVVFATVIAIALNPMVNYLTRKGMNRSLAIFLVVTVALLFVLGSLFFIAEQISRFSETYPKLLEKLNAIKGELTRWISLKFNIPQSGIIAWFKDTQRDIIRNFELTESLSQGAQLIVIITLVPVYLLMVLYYKPLLLEFLNKLFRSVHRAALSEVLTDTKLIIQQYLMGLFIELILVAVLNSVGLLILGIDYAILLGIIGALLNIIPYIGGIVAISLPMIIAFVTKETLMSPLLVFCLYMVIQFIDNNFIVPRIVASRVQLNGLVSLIVVLIGNAIWGIPGMFLSIPVTAIAKVICDHIESLKPWGYLMGNIVAAKPRHLFRKK